MSMVSRRSEAVKAPNMRILPPEFGGLTLPRHPEHLRMLAWMGASAVALGLGAAAVALAGRNRRTPPVGRFGGGLRPQQANPARSKSRTQSGPAAASARPSTLRAAGGPVRSAAVKKPAW